MPIPPLNQHGVLPTGFHECTLAEIEAAYTGNAHRQALWIGLTNFLTWTNSQPRPSNILVDGGFTSDKALPKDIDVVFDVSDAEDAVRNHWFFIFGTQRDAIFEQYRVDFWVHYAGAKHDLRAFFQYVRPEEAIVRGMQPGDRKGLLMVAQ